MKFNETITPDLRIQIPKDLVEFLRLNPGDKIDLYYYGLNQNHPSISWKAIIDERSQVCISNDVIKAHDIHPGDKICLWHDNPDTIYIKPGITWRDLNADNIVSRFVYDKLTIDIRCETADNNSRLYSAKLYGIDGIHWQKPLLTCKTDEHPNPDKVKELAMQILLNEANAEVEKRARAISEARGVAIILENLVHP